MADQSIEFDPAWAEQLIADGTNIATYQLPQLPEADAAEVYERITHAEATLASRGVFEDGYDIGTASVEDQVFVVRGLSSGLLTAEHATTQVRDGAPKSADWGTAGLGQIVHEDTGASFIAAIGRQTSDANSAPEHPVKDEIRDIMLVERPLVVAGLHGMAAGKFNELTDTRPLDVIVGIGDEPSERTEQVSEAIKGIAEDLGLRLGINQKFIRLDDSGQLAKRKDGTPGVARNAFSAKGEHTTRAYEQRVASDIGYEPALMQIELSSLLRRQPVGLEFDPKSSQMGVYLGYCLIKRVIELGQNPEL